MGFEVIENEKDNIDCFIAQGYGNNEILLSKHELEHILESLVNGKVIGFYDGEYTTTISLKQGDKEFA